MVDAAELPRSEAGDGSDLSIAKVHSNGDVSITDGERTVAYKALEGEPLHGNLSIVPAYVEAGWFTEANTITLSDGIRQAVYIPRDEIAAPDGPPYPSG